MPQKYFAVFLGRYSLLLLKVTPIKIPEFSKIFTVQTHIRVLSDSQASRIRMASMCYLNFEGEGVGWEGSCWLK
jgi:hypothetical protein